MASVLIIGASKGIGLETTHQLLAAGHQVRAFSRSVARVKCPTHAWRKFAATH